MTEQFIQDELREFILRRTENEEELARNHGPCYSISWDNKRSVLAVKVNNKRLMEIAEADVPETVDLRSIEFITHTLRVLRDGDIEGLKVHLEELKCGN